MHPKQLYLAWVRSEFPLVYTGALTRVLSPKAGLSGLGDDLTASILTPSDIQSTTVTGSDISDQLSPDVSAAIDQANQTPSSSSGWGDFFNNLSSAISNVGGAVIQTQAQSNLLQINTQRAQQNIGPLNQYGVPVTAQQLAPTSASLAQFEANLAGASGSPLLWIGLAAIVGLALYSGRNRG